MSGFIKLRKGDIFLARLYSACEGLLSGVRPCIIVSNHIHCDSNNPLINIIPITTRQKVDKPVYVLIPKRCGLDCDSVALVDQPQTISKSALINKIGQCDYDTILKLDKASCIQQSINRPFNINHALKLVESIKEIEKFATKYNIKLDEDDMRLKSTLIAELKSYCDQYNINYYKLFETVENKRLAQNT